MTPYQSWEGIKLLPHDESAVLEVEERVSRSVVNISTAKLLHDVFYQAVPVKGICSGTIVDPEGYIITNNHIIKGAERVAATHARR